MLLGNTPFAALCYLKTVFTIYYHAYYFFIILITLYYLLIFIICYYFLLFAILNTIFEAVKQIFPKSNIE